MAAAILRLRTEGPGISAAQYTYPRTAALNPRIRLTGTNPRLALVRDPVTQKFKGYQKIGGDDDEENEL